MEEKKYQLTEIILGENDKYLESTIITLEKPFEQIEKQAIGLQNEWEDGTFQCIYPEGAITMIHIILEYWEEEGIYSPVREFRITRQLDGTITDKTVYIYTDGQEQE